MSLKSFQFKLRFNHKRSFNVVLWKQSATFETAINHTGAETSQLLSEIIRVHIQEIQQIRKDGMMLEFLFLHYSVTSASSDKPLRMQVLPTLKHFTNSNTCQSLKRNKMRCKAWSDWFTVISSEDCKLRRVREQRRCKRIHHHTGCLLRAARNWLTSACSF